MGQVIFNYLIIGLTVVLCFGLVIFVHELGHFLMARLRGVGVEAFAIGFGPRIVAWRRGGTEYSIRWIPAGGFVKLHHLTREEAAEAEAEAQSAERPRSLGELAQADMAALYQQGFLTKVLVFGGGVAFNMLTAALALAALYAIGFMEPLPGPAWVGEVKPESAFGEAGLKSGDYIVEVEGVAVADVVQASRALDRARDSGAGADGLDVAVRRGDERLKLRLPPLTESTSETYFEDWSLDFPPSIAGVEPFRPAAKAGLQEGDLIVAVDGQAIERWSELVRLIQASVGEALLLTVQRPGRETPFPVTLVPDEDPANPGRGIIGILRGSGQWEFVREPIWEAAARAPGRAFQRFALISYLTYDLFRQAFRERNFGMIKRNVGGPIAIVAMTGHAARRGLSELMNWFVNFNLVLAFFNLLPIPVLDGGFLVLAIVEAGLRRPVSARVLAPIYTFFALLLISLMILISYQDLLKILP